MATVNFFDGFTYEWAQTGNVYAWDDAQYKQGWATIGAVPPSVEQFNRVHQVVDQKANWLYRQLATAAATRGITLSAADNAGLNKILDAILEAVPNASLTAAGKVELATDAEVSAGTRGDLAVTPSALNARQANTTRTGLIQVADTTEARAFVNTTKAITPAMLRESFLGVNASFASFGYQKMPSGMVIQWGILNSGAAGYQFVNFPIAFPVAFLSCSVVESAGGTENNATTTWTTSSATRTMFRANAYGIQNGGAVQRAPNSAGLFIAIGV